MLKSTKPNYIVVTLEIIDGEVSLLHQLLAEVRVGETTKRCANRVARNYIGEGRKLKKEVFFETAGGEHLIKIKRFIKVTTADLPILKKYFISV